MNHQENYMKSSLASLGQQSQNPKDLILISNCSNQEIIEELANSVRSIGFKKVTIKVDKIIYGIDNSQNSFEKQFLVYDLELFPRVGRYQCLRSYYSKRGKSYGVSKMYLEYILALISKINEQLVVGSFFYLKSTSQVYFEISQILPKYLGFLRRSVSRMTDELTSAMFYSKCFYLFIQYLKSIKSHFKSYLKKGTPLPSGLLKEIDEQMNSLLSQCQVFDVEIRAKDISLARAHLYPCIDSNKENQMIKELRTSADLAGLFVLNKYSIDGQQVKIPLYFVGKGYIEKTFYSSKILILAEKMINSPKILVNFQELLISLAKKGLRLIVYEISEKVKRVCHEDVIRLVREPVFYSFIVTSDNRILFAYDEFRQLSNSLERVEKNEDRVEVEKCAVEMIFEANLKAVELSCFDLSIIEADIDKFIEKVEN
jgi:hypothetical protein